MNKIETHTQKPELAIVVGDVTNRLISLESEVNLDTKISQTEDFMKNNDARGKTDAEKDASYVGAQTIHREYLKEFHNSRYNFYLNRPQYNFITDLILTKLDYNVDTIFIAIELTHMMGNMKTKGKYTNDADLVCFEITATELTYMYHLIAKHTVKGLGRQAYTFSEVLIRIGELSKIFNYYETANKNLVDDITQWVTLFDDSIQIEGQKIEPEAKVKKAKKKTEITE